MCVHKYITVFLHYSLLWHSFFSQLSVSIDPVYSLKSRICSLKVLEFYCKMTLKVLEFYCGQPVWTLIYRKGLGPSNLSGLDENLDYTCLDWAELLVYKFHGKFGWTVLLRPKGRSDYECLSQKSVSDLIGSSSCWGSMSTFSEKVIFGWYVWH